MNSPETYVQLTDGFITDSGEVTTETNAELLRDYIDEFHEIITRVYTA